MDGFLFELHFFPKIKKDSKSTLDKISFGRIGTM